MATSFNRGARSRFRRTSGRGMTFTVSWKLAPIQPTLKGTERTKLVQVLEGENGAVYDLLAYVVMDRSIHALVTPKDKLPLRSIVNRWRGEMARTLCADGGREGEIWEREWDENPAWGDRGIQIAAEQITAPPKRRFPNVDDYRWLAVFDLW